MSETELLEAFLEWLDLQPGVMTDPEDSSDPRDYDELVRDFLADREG